MLAVPSIVPVVPNMLVCHSLLKLVNVRNMMNRMAITFCGNVGSTLVVLYVTLNMTIPGVFTHHCVTGSHRGFLRRRLTGEGTEKGFVR